MKILMLTDSSFFPVRGGADRVVYEQATRLVQKGHEVTVLSRDKNSAANHREKIQGIDAYFLGVQAAGDLAGFQKIMQATRRALTELMPNADDWDLVCFHQPLLAFAARKSLLPRRLGRVYFFHSPVSAEFALRRRELAIKNWFKFKLLKWMEWRALNQSHLVVYASKYMEKLSEEVHPRLEGWPHRILPLGVDLAKFVCKQSSAEERARLKLWPERPTAFTVRNLEPRMGLEALLEAWKMVIMKIPQAYLVVGGEGSLRPALEGKIKKWGLENNVRLTGFISENELPLYYRAADFFVLPTREMEGFGLVILEALSSGTPVLGTQVGAIPEVLAPLDGDLLFGSRRSHVMAERIQQFIRAREWEKWTPQRCRRYVEERYSWDRHVSELEELFKETRQIARSGR